MINFLESLPRKRGGSGVLIFDKNEKILLLKPTYKDNWEIPGGIIEEGESPRECCVREVREELGIDIELGGLLCLEYQREQDDSYMFVFDGGVIEETHIQLSETEIVKYEFCDMKQAEKYVLPKMLHRIQQAIDARKQQTTIYYETIYHA